MLLFPFILFDRISCRFIIVEFIKLYVIWNICTLHLLLYLDFQQFYEVFCYRTYFRHSNISIDVNKFLVVFQLCKHPFYAMYKFIVCSLVFGLMTQSCMYIPWIWDANWKFKAYEVHMMFSVHLHREIGYVWRLCYDH